VPKVTPKGVTDGQLVNIPALPKLDKDRLKELLRITSKFIKKEVKTKSHKLINIYIKSKQIMAILRETLNIDTS